MKVSWQVTGTRKDAFALKHPMIVEEDKGSIKKDSHSKDNPADAARQGIYF